jgi:4,5-DOPA dioxygenase extradiol
MAKMPAVFVGHGSPMNALETNRFTTAWASFAASIEKPSAVLAISAHWFINATVVTSMAHPRVIHDFYGFPQELFDFDYPAPGDTSLARHVGDIVDPVWVGLDEETWGIDHGTWSVLAHMFPEADVPVVQLAIDASKPLDYHLDLGGRLAPLRDEGVLIVASGNVVHNLGVIDWLSPEQGYDWAQRFDDDARTLVSSDPGALGDLVASDDFKKAVPTPDHFLPLAYLAGLAATDATTPQTFVRGCTLGSLSMTSYALM